jgi:hypothetical protein
MIPLSAFVCLALLLRLTAVAQAPQTASSTAGIPTFYAQGWQVIVEAEVWKGDDKKNANDASWIPQALPGLPNGGAEAIKILRLWRPPAPGLIANDFRVFDNGVEQRINYFKETDFAAVASVSEAYGLWVVDPVTRGIWATLHPNQGIPYAPAATYLIGYIPPALQPGECHAIKVVVQNRYIQLSRNQYCALKDNDANVATANEAKLWERMQNFANSGTAGAIKVSVRAFAFWSSGVLSLARQAPSTATVPVLPVRTLRTSWRYTIPRPRQPSRSLQNSVPCIRSGNFLAPRMRPCTFLEWSTTQTGHLKGSFTILGDATW